MPPKTRRPKINHHFKIDEQLPPDLRAVYRELLHEPRTTIDTAHAWLTARGLVLSRSAVARHRRHVLSHAQACQRRLTELRFLADYRKHEGDPGFTEAAVIQLEHLIFQLFMEINIHEPHTPAQLLELSKLVTHTVRTRLKLESARPKPDPAESLSPEQKEKNLHQRIREILNIPDDPTTDSHR